MIIVSRTQFHVCVLNVQALVGAFNQEKALVRAFSVIVKSSGAFAAGSRPSLMIIVSRTQFHVERPWVQRPFSIVS